MARRRLARHCLQALTLIIGLLVCRSYSLAASTPIPHGTLELVAENQWIPPGRDFHLGLHFQLEKGWHIYWVNPGDSGEPPRVTWHLPAGLAAGAIEWPTPLRLAHSSIVDFGYEDSVTLVVPLHADASLAPGTTPQLAADVRVLVCREICIPGKAQLSLTLPVQSQPPAPDGPATALFAATLKSLPQRAPTNWRFIAQEAKDSFVLIANIGHQVTKATFFPLVDPQIDNAAPQKIVPRATGFRLTLIKSARLNGPVDHLKGVLVLSGNRAYVIDVPVGKPNATAKPAVWQNGSGSKIRLLTLSAGGPGT
jgi:DsbC/DsbD-like thiol-disulfide interchange protein